MPSTITFGAIMPLQQGIVDRLPWLLQPDRLQDSCCTAKIVLLAISPRLFDFTARDCAPPGANPTPEGPQRTGRNQLTRPTQAWKPAIFFFFATAKGYVQWPIIYLGPGWSIVYFSVKAFYIRRMATNQPTIPKQISHPRYSPPWILPSAQPWKSSIPR